MGPTAGHPQPAERARSVLACPAPEVAPLLLGAWLHHGPVTVRITEVEAYGGEGDPASHAFRGRTARNEAMFGRAGLLYCYLVYGVHHCCNVVTGALGEGSAVLLRAGEVVAGESVVRTRRGDRATRDLARGPGCLARALGLDRGHDGTDLLVGAPEPGPQLAMGSGPAVPGIRRGPRVGVRAAAEAPERYWLPDEPSVSTYRPARHRVRT